jgi:hypothetical protein
MRALVAPSRTGLVQPQAARTLVVAPAARGPLLEERLAALIEAAAREHEQQVRR